MEKKITIGLFIDTYFPMMDGVTMVVDNYAKRFNKYANVVVFAPKMYRQEFDDSCFSYKVERCKSLGVPFIDYSFPIPKLDKKFMKKLNEYKLDIVHIHSPATLGKLGIEYAKKNNVPVVATMHSQFKQDIKRAVKSERLANYLTHKLIKITYDKCDECWAVSDEIARVFHEEYEYKEIPKVMNNATEMKPVQNPINSKEKICKKYGIKGNEKIFLFVGRINVLKNIFLIVDSIKELKNNHPDLAFKMMFVGSGQDEEKLKKAIKDNNLENDIILCGRIMDRTILADYYASADLFLFPSLYDASSLVQVEAASQKTPTIFVRGAATASTIIDGQNGFLSDSNPVSYSNKIYEVLKNRELYSFVSNNCYRELYKNWDDVTKKALDRYMKLIKLNG